MPYSTVVDRETVNAHLDDPEWLLFDCRFDLANPESGRLAYRKTHLPGAVYVHLDDDLAGSVGEGTGRHPLPDTHDFSAKLRAWGVSPGKQLVAYDDGPGAMAVRFWWLCRHLGIEGVAVMSGGIEGWERDGRELATDVPKRNPGSFQPEVRENDTVAAGGLLEAIERGESLLLDARAGERFRGETEPIDSKAGHVPGAVNRPFSDNLDDRGEIKDPEILRRELGALIGDRDPRTVAHMCGSGVTACHNLLAMEHAGLSGSKLYAGSWSHWITDPDRPVAKGDCSGD